MLADPSQPAQHLCPICKRPAERRPADAKAYFPFCSERCKLIDLGRWLGGRYQIPVAEDNASDHPQELGD
jgi:endogenous inhibitor of DNA gyrase (YacG/DUF329 family)